MEKVITNNSSYFKSKELYDLGVKNKIEKGSFFFDQLITDDILICIDNDIDSKNIVGINLEDGDIKTYPQGRVLKSYNVSELGKMIPLEYMLPRPFEEGWAFVSEDGEVILIQDDDYYSTEAEARITFLIYLIKLKQITPQQLNI